MSIILLSYISVDCWFNVGAGEDGRRLWEPNYTTTGVDQNQGGHTQRQKLPKLSGRHTERPDTFQRIQNCGKTSKVSCSWL